MDILANLYSKEEVTQLFNETALLEFLIKDSFIKSEAVEFANRQILVSDKSDEKIYFIKDGLVSVTSEEQILFFLGPGHFIGLENIVFQDTTSFTFTSVGKVNVIEFNKNKVIEALMSLQEGWMFLYLINRNIEKIIVEHLHFYQKKAKHRVEAMLRSLATEIKYTSEDYVFLPKALNHGLLINYMGISYVTFKKICRELKHEEFLIHKKRKGSFGIAISDERG